MSRMTCFRTLAIIALALGINPNSGLCEPNGKGQNIAVLKSVSDAFEREKDPEVRQAYCEKFEFIRERLRNKCPWDTIREALISSKHPAIIALLRKSPDLSARESKFPALVQAYNQENSIELKKIYCTEIPFLGSLGDVDCARER